MAQLPANGARPFPPDSSQKAYKMKTIQTEKNGIVYVSLEGRMGKALNPGFEKTIREILKSDTRRLLFDLYPFPY